MGNPAPNRKKKSDDLLLSRDDDNDDDGRRNADHLHALIEPNARMSVKDSTGLRYDAVTTADHPRQVRDGSYPLHMAVQASASIDVLEILIKAEEEILLKTNKFGQTPLHLALERGAVGTPDAFEATVEVLLHGCDRGKEAVRVRDTIHGNFPLHVAAKEGCTVRVAKSLLDTWPEAVHETNADGLTTMDLALEHGKCPGDVLCLFSISEDSSVTEDEQEEEAEEGF